MRSHCCAEVDSSVIGQEVTVCGWVQTRRDHGGVVFVDLRDRSGIIQVVADPDVGMAFEAAEHLRNESVIRARGLIRQRPEGTVNPDLCTGDIELFASEIETLNVAEALPFQLDDAVNETTRLKYRFLDLRRSSMNQTIRRRHAIVRNLRNWLEMQDFIEIETPILTRSTPEGARDYLVPSRTQNGHFYALPQSPQIFKQLLMVAGFERYYQIARCFRDEDLRADRQPEFTQLDIEMSFVDEQEVMSLMEAMIRKLFKSVMDINLPEPFPRMTYTECMSRYGTDRPDLRIALQLTEIKDLMKDVEFKVFSGPANDVASRVTALCVPGGAAMTRQQIDSYPEYVKQFGARGLAYIKVNDMDAGRDGLQSPILKFLPDDVLIEVMKRVAARSGDLVFFAADKSRVVNDTLGNLRLKLAGDLKLVQESWQPLWVVDFPLVEYDAGTGRYQALHHPFTAPRVEDVGMLESHTDTVLSRAYDLVINGSEIGGGSIRIHNREIQHRVFKLLGISEEEASQRFGFLLEGLKYGAPPHGGIAFGIDRLAAMMSGSESIRDVIAFPKTQKATCLMTEAPSVVDDNQLRDLGLRLRNIRSPDTEETH